jgi:uncharacterized membrane protein
MNKCNVMYGLVVLFFILTVTGCSNSAPQTVTGVAAAGSPIVGTIYLKDSSVPAQERSTQTAADGSFKIDVNGLQEPYLLKAVGTVNGTAMTLYSFATTVGIANINPLSHLALAQANAQDDLSTLYNTATPFKMQWILGRLSSAISTVQTALAPTLAKVGATSTNFISAPYVVDHRGLDLLFDLVGISTGNGRVSIVDRTDNSSTYACLADLSTTTINEIAINNPIPGEISLWPATITLEPNATTSFTAIIVGTTNQQITWSIVEENSGTVTTDGHYQAPGTTGTYHVTATSVANPTKSATATVTVKRQNVIDLVMTGTGTYELQGKDLSDVYGLSLRFTYDPTKLSSPVVSRGPMANGTTFAANTSLPGIVAIALIRTTAISGSGTFASVSFNVLGDTTSAITSVSLSTAPAFTPPAIVTPDCPSYTVPGYTTSSSVTTSNP